MSDRPGGFYVTLLSDASLDLYPDNSCASFSNRLRSPLDLRGGDWEVALVDLSYPHNWLNVPRTRLLFCYTSPEVVAPSDAERRALLQMIEMRPEALSLLVGQERITIWGRPDDPRAKLMRAPAAAAVVTAEPLRAEMHPEELNYEDAKALYELHQDLRIVWAAEELDMLALTQVMARRLLLPYTIPAGYADSVDELMRYLPFAMQQLQSSLWGLRTPLELEAGYDPVSERVFLRAHANGSFYRVWIITTDAELFNMLGLRPSGQNREGRNVYIYRAPTRGTNRPRLPRVESIRVESDLAEPQLLGEREEPLLGMLPVMGRHREQVYWAPPQALYLPLTERYIESIELRLRTDKGEPVPFVKQAGKVFARLHFRRRRV